MANDVHAAVAATMTARPSDEKPPTEFEEWWKWNVMTDDEHPGEQLDEHWTGDIGAAWRAAVDACLLLAQAWRGKSGDIGCWAAASDGQECEAPSGIAAAIMALAAPDGAEPLKRRAEEK